MKLRSTLLILLLISTAQASPLATVRVLEDTAGDAVITVNGMEQQDSANPSNDLRFLDIEEHVDGFWFILGIEAIERPGDEVSQSNSWWVDFKHGLQEYRLQFIWGADGGWRTDAYRIDASGGRELFHRTAIERDFDAHTLSSFFPRDLLRDENGAPPSGDAQFTDLHVHISPPGVISLESEPTPGGGDSMPDDGPSATPYEVVWGVESEGPITMSSPLPYRSSNGAATTYLFELLVENTDVSSHRYFFRDPTLPPGWEVRFPADGLTLESNEVRTVPVLISLPFAHQHGTIESTVLELESDDGSSVGRTEVGVLFLETPQPSGHHPTMWMHTREQVAIEEAGWHLVYTPGADVVMSTLEDDPSNDGTPIRGYIHEGGYEWYVFLEPGLLTGLDFRVGEAGTVTTKLSSDRLVPGASLSGGLFLMGRETADSYDDRPGSLTGRPNDFGGRELTQLAELPPSAATDLSGDLVIESPLNLMSNVDVVEPAVGQTLMLRLRLEGPLPPSHAGEPTLLPGGVIELPVDEYADPVDTSFLTEAVDIQAASSQERWANPGDALLMRAVVHNPGAEPLDLGLELSGQGAVWSSLHGPATRTIAPGESEDVQVIVRIPEGAVHADRADLVLEAFDATDPTMRSLVRYVAHVDTALELDDDSAIIPEAYEGKETPVGLWLAPLAAVLALALRRTKDE